MAIQPTIYDAPRQVLSNLFEGKFTTTGALAAFFDPARTTAAERKTFADDLKKAVGGNPVIDTLVDIFTNPLTYMAFVFSPVGARAFGAAGKSGFQVAKQFGAFVQDRVPLLARIGGYHPLRLVENTPASAILMQAQNGIREISETQATQRVYRALQQFQERTGLSTLKRGTGALNESQERLLQEMNDTVFASLAGWDRPLAMHTPMVDDALNLTWKMVQRDRLVTANLEERLAQLGATEVRDAMREVMRERLVKVWGKEGVSTFEVDPDKVIRAWRSLSHSVFNGRAMEVADGDKAFGLGVIRRLLGTDVAAAIERGKIGYDDFKRLVGNAFQGAITEGVYFPRNVSEAFGEGGVALGKAWNPRTQYRVFGSKTSVFREQITGNYHPDDLARISASLGGTEELATLERSMRGALVDPDRTQALRLFRADLMESMDKYLDETARTYAWFSQAPNDEVVALQRIYNQQGKAQEWADLKHFTARDGSKVPVNVVMDAAAPQPIGGYSLADAAEAVHSMLADKEYARYAFANIMVPASVGHFGVEHSMMKSAILNAKVGLRAMSDGFVGRALEKLGPYGKQVVAEMRRIADPNSAAEVVKEAADSLGGRLASATSRWLYATHLGINMASVVLNSTQPALLAATWLGGTNVLKAYPSVLKQMLGYARERAEMGLGPITPAAKHALIRKHFRLAGAATEGEDLIGIAPELFDGFDSIGAGGLRPYEKPRGVRLGLDYMLKMFEKVEWLNRAVAAEAAVGAAAARKGISSLDGVGDDVLRAVLKDPVVRVDVRRAVLETQFGNNPLNTPLFFQTADPKMTKLGLLSNQLLRQFLAFPYRSMAATFSYSGMLGEGRRSFLGQEFNASWIGATGIDFLRGMGISAIIYETGKGLLGADLSPGLYYSAATDLFGRRLMNEGRDVSPLPLPPIVQIPWDLARSVLGADADLFKATLPRLLPGGVAMARLMGVGPDLPAPFSGVQRTYVGWNEPTPDGMVPVYKPDGSLVSYQNPRDLVLRSLGLDLGRFQQQGALDNWLNKNNAEMLDYRKRAEDALHSNNVEGYQVTAAEFEKRFGFKMPITTQTFRNAERLRQVPRTERIIGRMPAEARGVYAAAAGLGGASVEASQGSLLSAASGASQEAMATLPSAFGSYQGFEGYQSYRSAAGAPQPSGPSGP